MGGAARVGDAAPEATSEELLAEWTKGAKVGGSFGAALPIAIAGARGVATPISESAGRLADRHKLFTRQCLRFGKGNGTPAANGSPARNIRVRAAL